MSPARIDARTPGRLPLIVLTDHLFDGMARRIRAHTRGYYNHAMWLYRPGAVASQEWMYRDRPLADFLDGAHRVKLWGCDDWTPDARRDAIARIEADLAAPWYRRLYDALGILGHAIGARALNAPHLAYCSERVADVLRDLDPRYTARHPSPADINRWCKRTPGYRVVGLWDPDAESLTPPASRP
jgi:hypothetical protein